MQTHRHLRSYLRQHWVNAHPESFRWVPHFIRWAYHHDLSLLYSYLRILHKWLTPDGLFENILLSQENIRMRLRLADAIQASIFYSGCYEPHLVNWLRKHIKSSSIFFDVGAHCGQYALIASQTQPGVEVYAFEPDAENVADLRHNIKINHLNNIHVMQVAVADKIGKAPLFLDNENFGFINHSLASGLNVFSNEAYEIDIITLDNIASMAYLPVSLIKMDIEGAELLALQGAQAILQRDHPALILEVDPRWTCNFHYEPKDVQVFLEGFGYVCYSINQNGFLQRISPMAEVGGPDWIALHTGLNQITPLAQ